MPLAADEVLLYPRRRRYIFSVAHSNCADAFIAVARFEGAEETVVASRFFRGALEHLRIHISLVARFGTLE